MNEPLRLLSSMATRALLDELARAHATKSGVPVAFEAVGGVEATRRVSAGEPFDVVALASDAIDRLAEAGHLDAAGKVDLVRSEVGVAVRADAARPDIGSEEALRRAVLEAPRIGYSTGPSGTALMALFARWGITGALEGRLVQAAPGVPVAALLARGEVALGFQQMSELLGMEGIAVLGTMPPAVRITTVFSAAPCSASVRHAEAQALLGFLDSPGTAQAKRRHGMEPIR